MRQSPFPIDHCCWTPACRRVTEEYGRARTVKRVWLSSPNLMPEARAHVSKVGVASGYTHTLRASANYSSSSNQLGRVDSWILSPYGVHYQGHTDDLNELLAQTLCSHCLHMY